MLNIRIKHVLGVLENLNFNNILDVGCRDCSISKAIEKIYHTMAVIYFKTMKKVLRMLAILWM